MQIDRTLQLDASPIRREPEQDPEDEDQRTLFCANLNENVTDELLYELFIQSGPVESVNIPKDKEGRPRPFGFVTYVHSCSVPYALELYTGIRLFNRELIIRYSNANNAGARSNNNQNPTPRPRNDGNPFSRGETPRQSRPRIDDGDNRQISRQRQQSPDNNALRTGSGHGGGGGSNRFDSSMRPALSSSSNDSGKKNPTNPFNISDLDRLGTQFLFKPFSDAIDNLFDSNLNSVLSNNNSNDSPLKQGGRSNRQHIQTSPYYNKRKQSSRGGNANHNRGRRGDWDRSSNQRQGQRRRR